MRKSELNNQKEISSDTKTGSEMSDWMTFSWQFNEKSKPALKLTYFNNVEYIK